jgi:hypothetical protein
MRVTKIYLENPESLEAQEGLGVAAAPTKLT